MKLTQLIYKATTKYSVRFLVVVCILIVPAILSAIDDVYHDLDEIYIEMMALQEEYPEWITIDSVGFSSMYNLPIWMAKISENPQQSENEPALLYIGQVHAEEIIGVEVTLHLMRYILENLEEDIFVERLEGVELYFIPTVNPEGLRVVHSGDDITFRKNCRDNYGDGELRIQDEAGWDTSGVDLNRNFDLHWDRGLELYERDDGLPYNYYRGPAPFSEPETQMLRDLARQKNFLFSLSYHSSRSGQNSELVIAPWNWEGKAPPDYIAIDALLDTVANLIPSILFEDDHYAPVHSMQRVGQSNDWFYQATGTFQYLIEIGEDIQPDSAALMELIDDQIVAAIYILDLAAGLQTLDNVGHLVINTFDETTGELISVNIVNNQYSDPIIEPRRSTIENGRFDWLLPIGEYDFTFSALGYVIQQIDGVEIFEGEFTQLDVQLVPLLMREVTIEVLDASDNLPIEAVMRLHSHSELIGTWTIPVEGLQLNIPGTIYDLELLKDNFLPLKGEIEFLPDSNNVTLYLYPSEVTFDYQFDEMGNWQHGGVGDGWGIHEFDGRSVLTESPDGAYMDDGSPWVLIQTGAEIQDDFQSVIRLIHHTYFEPGADSAMVNIWNRDSNSWITHAAFSKFPTGWDTTYINCFDLPAGSISIRFQITSDYAVTEDGWSIDRLTIYRSTLVNDNIVEPSIPDGYSISLFPNPTNGYTSLQLKLINTADYNYEIYDARGRRVASKMMGTLVAGEHNFYIDTGSYTSGVYFIHIGSSNQTNFMKLTLLK